MAENKQSSPSLLLQVMNGGELESGRPAKCLFTREGGAIGSAEDCHWSVQDREQTVTDKACAVVMSGSVFCLKNLSGQIWINQAPVAATSALIQLRQGDEILLGSLLLKVFLSEGKHTDYDEQMAAPETIVTNRDRLVDILLTTEGQPEYPGMSRKHQMADTVVNSFSTDPLQVLQTESLTVAGSLFSDTPPGRSSSLLSGTARNNEIDTPFMDLPPIYAEPRDKDTPVEMAQRHLAVTPLLRGLGCSLTVYNSKEADDFLEEVGRTLQAAIKGLLDLQQRRNSLSDKHLRPLEDNPLRLNMSYDSALDVMFAEGKSPVHLAAPAAVGESLRNIRHHDDANRAAIVESLRVLLDAFPLRV